VDPHRAGGRLRGVKRVGVGVTFAILVVGCSSSHRAGTTGPTSTSSPNRRTAVASSNNAGLPLCSRDELRAAFGYGTVADGLGGSVLLTNVGSRVCVLWGRPDDVEILGKNGQLRLTQTAGGRAPSAGLPPRAPIRLPPNGHPTAGVLLEWQNWCDGRQGTLGLSVHFVRWRASLLAVPMRVSSPTFAPPCTRPHAASVLYVD
jgi:hypothetical protein